MGLSQHAFAERLGVSRNYVSMLENGREPSTALLRLIETLETEFVKSGAPAQALPETPTPRAKLRAAREKKGLSIPQLAKLVGYTPSVYREIEEGLSQMGEKMALKIASALGIDVEEITNGSDHPPERGAMRGTFGTVPEVNLGPGLEKSRAKFVPLLSMAQCGTMAAYDDQAYAHEGFLAIDSKDSKAFAVTLAGDSMTPVFAPGDVAVVYPQAKPRNGDLVIAKLSDDEGGDVMFKLYQAAGDRVTLSSYNPAYQPLQWSRAAFRWIYPVASVTKVFRR